MKYKLGKTDINHPYILEILRASDGKEKAVCKSLEDIVNELNFLSDELEKVRQSRLIAWEKLTKSAAEIVQLKKQIERNL